MFQVQQALAQLYVAVIDLGLSISLIKTEAIKFRREGGIAATDILYVARLLLAYVSRFP